jgi:hypothetical protein
MHRFGARRSDPAFRAHSDLILEQVEALEHADTGAADYSRFKSR